MEIEQYEIKKKNRREAGRGEGGGISKYNIQYYTQLICYIIQSVISKVLQQVVSTVWRIMRLYRRHRKWPWRTVRRSISKGMIRQVWVKPIHKNKLWAEGSIFIAIRFCYYNYYNKSNFIPI